MDLKVKNRSNHQNDIKYEFLDLKCPQNRILFIVVGQTIEKIISSLANGGHVGFWALTELAHTFARGMGAKFFI